MGVENWICDTGPSSSDIFAGYKERRDSTDSDKENEVESLIQFPDNGNAFNYNQQHHQHPKEQADLFCKEKNFSNKKSANDSVRNIWESHAEENLDHLLTDLFIEDDAEKKPESYVKPVFELPQPEEIGLASIPETSDLVLSLCTNSNYNDNSNQSQPRQFSGNLAVDLQKPPFQDANQLEDQKELDGALSPWREMEEQLDGGACDVFLGYETSSLDEDIKRALEYPASKDIDFLQDVVTLDVDIEALQEDIQQVLLLSGDQLEDSLTKYAEFATNHKTEEQKEDDVPGVRTRQGRKRKPGTVVDLLVSNFTRKRSSRCKDCGPCRAPDCGECVFCLDKPKFGGPNKKKGACLERKCLNMSLPNTRLTPVQSGLEDEDTRIETVEEVRSNSSDDGETMNSEDGKAVKHDHCYSMNGVENKAASEEFDLWCYESLDEFFAETLDIQLQKNPDPLIRNILGKECENHGVLEVSSDNNLTTTQRAVISEEYEETGKFFKDLVPPPPSPVHYEDQKARMLIIKPNIKVKRRRRNFK